MKKQKPNNNSTLKAISYKLKANNGFSLLEAILASATFVLFVAAITGALIYGQESVNLSGTRARALFFAEEGLEVLRNLKEADFAQLPEGTKYGLEIVDSKWRLVANSPDTQDIFTREIEIQSISDSKKQVKSIVTWQQNPRRVGRVILTSLLTNWQKSTIIPSQGDWTKPFEESYLDFSGDQAGRKVKTQGNLVFVVRAGGNPDFVVINITDPQKPSIVGSLNLPGTPINLVLGGNYAFIASAYDSQELQIVDISSPSTPQMVASLDAAGSANANALAYSDSKIYLVRTSSSSAELFIINVSSPTSPSLQGSLDLGATGYDIYIEGSYAFVATSHNSRELIVVNIQNPSTPNLASFLDLPGNTDAVSICGFSGVAILGRSLGEIFVLNTINSLSVQTYSTFNIGSRVNDFALGNDFTYLFIASDQDLGEFQLFNISDLTQPTAISVFDQSNDLNGVTYHSVIDRAFVVGDDPAKEFVVIAPTPM